MDNTTIDIFEQFLLDYSTTTNEPLDIHIIFSMGTVVRIAPDAPSLPLVLPTRQAHRDYIQSIFDDPCVTIPTTIHETAIQMLLQDGFPTPGDDSTRAATNITPPNITADMPLWQVKWINRNANIYNVIPAETAETANLMTIEARRFDYLYPKIVSFAYPDSATNGV